MKILISENSGDLSKNQTRNLGLLFIIAIVFHGVLIPYTIPGTYDAYIHMFFGDHYHRNWFDPWEPRWYTGFSTTSYPPATHMMIATLMHVLPLKGAYTFTMLLGLLTLVLGFYRFVRIWAPQAAFISTLLLIVASSIAQTIHIFGQLPTIFSLGIFLNAMPFVYRWLVFGGFGNLLAAVIISAAATSAHHVTTIFGSVFFIGPLAAYGWLIYLGRNQTLSKGFGVRNLLSAFLPVFRGIFLAVAIVLAVIITVFPYWYWSLTDPITQVPIPHGTRENFLVRTDLGLVFFLMPWGVMLLFIPYFLYRGFSTILWPFAASMFLCFILGLGGTTPFSRMLLRGAFDILTLDRFTFWATILALPFMGMTILQISEGRLGRLMARRLGRNSKHLLLAFIALGFGLISVSIGSLGAHKNLQPKAIDPAPIVQFMESDEHDRWRYLTLGFGDQFAYISAQTTALSVDGNYHSARRLPAMTRYSVERLENAKYMGVAGLGSLQQFLSNANDYHLKYIFSNDRFYDPLLYASGWDAIVRLPNNIMVWEKPNIDPLPFVVPRKNFPTSHRLMWGIVPPMMCLLGYMLIGLSAFQLFRFGRMGDTATAEIRGFRARLDLKVLVWVLLINSVSLGVFIAQLEWKQSRISTAPDGVISRYYWHLNARQFQEAYDLLDPETRPDYEAFWFARMWQGGLINSFGSLLYMDIALQSPEEDLRDYSVKSHWMTALGKFDVDEEIRTVRRGRSWYIVPTLLPPHQTPERVMARNEADFHVVGRRQSRVDTDLYKDMPDRPEFAVGGARLVKARGRYSVIGLVHNTDIDPLSLSIHAELFDEDHEKLISHSAGVTTPFRLLPSESSGFRVDFEGRLSLDDAQQFDGFNPDIYVPPIYENPPRYAYTGLSSTIADDGLYRGVMLTNIKPEIRGDALVLSGQAVNNGTQVLTTIKILATVYDESAAMRWVETAFVKEVMRPGQSTDFEIVIPKSDSIEVVYDLMPQDVNINLNLENQTQDLPSADQATIPLGGIGGYDTLRLYVDPQVYREVL